MMRQRADLFTREKKKSSAYVPVRRGWRREKKKQGGSITYFAAADWCPFSFFFFLPSTDKRGALNALGKLWKRKRENDANTATLFIFRI